MNLKKQCINLEYAKRLKELGVKQMSLFYWRDYNSNAVTEIIFSPNNFHENAVTVYDYYSAFTVSELLELLTSINDSHPQLIRGNLVGEDQLKYCCRYGWEDDQNKLFVDINPANSCAKMLIYLIKNGFLDDKKK